MTDRDKILSLQDMLSALHFEAMMLPCNRVPCSSFDQAMMRVEDEFENDRDFQRRFG